MTELLVVVADRRIMGEIRRDRRGRLTFIYDDRWRSMDAAYPLSLSMPLVVAEHEHAGSTPGSGTASRQRSHPGPLGTAVSCIAPQRFCIAQCGRRGLRRRHPTGTTGQGRRCSPGRGPANRMVDRSRNRRTPTHPETRSGGVAHGTRCRPIQPRRCAAEDGASLRRSALGVPSGPTPTTHILKPPIDGLDGHAENEHLCLTLARALGLPAARSEVRSFGDEPAIVVERYDRIRLAGSIRRIHQEDMCQVLGLPPTKKYQNEGGPGCAEMSEAIWTHSGEPGDDARTFARAIMLNWIVGGTDAHSEELLHADRPPRPRSPRTSLRRGKHFALRRRSPEAEDGHQDRREILA